MAQKIVHTLDIYTEACASRILCSLFFDAYFDGFFRINADIFHPILQRKDSYFVLILVQKIAPIVGVCACSELFYPFNKGV